MKKTTEELLMKMRENNKKPDLWKLENDKNGNFLLDPANSSHRE